MIASSDLNPQITRINFRKFLPPEARTDQRQGFTLTLSLQLLYYFTSNAYETVATHSIVIWTLVEKSIIGSVAKVLMYEKQQHSSLL